MYTYPLAVLVELLSCSLPHTSHCGHEKAESSSTDTISPVPVIRVCVCVCVCVCVLGTNLLKIMLRRGSSEKDEHYLYFL